MKVVKLEAYPTRVAYQHTEVGSLIAHGYTVFYIRVGIDSDAEAAMLAALRRALWTRKSRRGNRRRA